jgi:hypothetical protein
MPNEKRRIERLVMIDGKAQFEAVPMPQLKKGDHFRMFEDEKPVEYLGETEFFATSDGRMNEQGVGEVDAEAV